MLVGSENFCANGSKNFNCGCYGNFTPGGEVSCVPDSVQVMMISVDDFTFPPLQEERVELEQLCDAPNPIIARFEALRKKQKIETMPLQIPMNIADFPTLRRGDYHYVDRTLYICELENARIGAALFLRPRRFGKSLFLSTLGAWHDKGIPYTEHEELFKGTHIATLASDGIALPPRRFYILHLDLAYSMGNRSNNDEQLLNDSVNGVIFDFWVKYKSELGEPQEAYSQSASCVTNLQRMLSRVKENFERTNTAVFLLVDEYDARGNNEQLLSGLEYNKWQQESREAMALLKKLFLEFKTFYNDRQIARMFITGVTPLPLADFLSGFTTAIDISFYQGFAEMCGLLESEVRYALSKIFDKPADVDKHYQLVKENYNGYLFSPKGVPVFNTTSVLQYLQVLMTKEPVLSVQNFVVPSAFINILARTFSGRRLLHLVLERSHVKQEIQIPGDQIILKYKMSDLVLDKENTAQLLSLFVHLGGLTFTSKNGWLRVSNLPALQSIFTEVQKVYSLSGDSSLARVISALVKEDFIQPLCLVLETAFLSYRTNEDLDKHTERDTQQIISLALMTRATPVQLEVSTLRQDTENIGYIDILVMVPSAIPKLIIIEVKNKQARWLDVPRSGSSLAKAEKLLLMNEPDLMELKTTPNDRINPKESMETILDKAALQVRQYAESIKAKYPNSELSAYVLLSIGSRRCLAKKVLGPVQTS